jgi:hypothetical protein
MTVAGWVLAGEAELPALGQVIPGPSEVQVAATATFQAAPAVAWESGGDFVIAWQKQSAAGGWDVFARQYGAGGTPLGNEFQVNTTSGAGCRQFPAVAADAQGDFVAAWQSDQESGGSFGIYGQRFGADGHLIGTEFHVNTTTAGSQQAPAVAMAPDGRFLIAWQSDGQDGSSWGIYGQAYAAGGAPAGGEFAVNQTTAGAQHSPAVAYVNSAVAPDRFQIVWQSESQDGSGAGAAGIFMRSFGGAGNPLSGEVAVNAPATGAHAHPRIAADPSGNFVVVWENTTGAGSAVVLRRFISTGVALSGQLTVDPGAVGAQRNPMVAADAIGDFVVAWDAPSQDGSGTAVLAQQFDHREIGKGGKVELNLTTAGDQSAAGIGMTPGGSLLVSWQSQTPGGDAATIAARPAALPALSFYTVFPCRMVDTRNAPGPLGGPILTGGQPRTFPLVSSPCGVPIDAKAISINSTVVPNAAGSLVLYPGDAAAPLANGISFEVGEVHANNAVLPLSLNGDGSLSVLPALTPSNGTVHVIIDVNGYFQ